MTEEQNKLVTDHLPDIYRCLNAGTLVKNPYFFAKYCRCEIDDIKQLAAFGLTKAAIGYDPSIGVKFMTFAITVVRRELLRYLRYNKNKDRNKLILSLDYPLPMKDDNELNLLDFVPTNESYESHVLFSIDSAKLSYRQHAIVQLTIAGYKQREIAEMLKISQVAVSRNLHKAVNFLYT